MWCAALLPQTHSCTYCSSTSVTSAITFTCRSAPKLGVCPRTVCVYVIMGVWMQLVDLDYAAGSWVVLNVCLVAGPSQPIFYSLCLTPAPTPASPTYRSFSYPCLCTRQPSSRCTSSMGIHMVMWYNLRCACCGSPNTAASQLVRQEWAGLKMKRTECWACATRAQRTFNFSAQVEIKQETGVAQRVGQGGRHRPDALACRLQAHANDSVCQPHVAHTV